MKSIYRCVKCGKYVEEPYHCDCKAQLLLDGRRREMLSKLISGILRHYPWEVGLVLDDEGWVDIDELVSAIKNRWRNKKLYQWIDKEHIIALAILDPKGRFEVNNNKIRARYGHSIAVRIRYREEEDVKLLYHGTSTKNLRSIFKLGVKPMKRLWVHMTLDKEEACRNAQRHSGKPIVLTIDADCLRKKGLKVYKASNIIYLVKYVPVECINDVDKCEV